MRRLFLLILFPVAQITFSIIIGYFALSLAAPSGSVRSGVVYAGADFSGMDIQEAASAIQQINETKIEKGLAGFSYNDIEFVFHFNEINFTADYSGIEKSLTDKDSPTYIKSLLTAFTRNYGPGPRPVYSADADAFREKLMRMKEYIDIAPVNADINYSRESGIIKIPSAKGVSLDVDGQFDYIYQAFLSNPFDLFEINSDSMLSALALVYDEPPITDTLIADIDAVLADISTPVPAGLNTELLADVAESINKVWAPRKNMAYAPVSFLRYISEAGLPVDKPVREYDFVASALLHALLVGGNDYSMMEFVGSREVENDDLYEAKDIDENYLADIENYKYGGIPGFDVVLLSSGGLMFIQKDIDDFTFTNSLDSDIVIFAYVEEGMLNIIVAGSSKLVGRRAAPYEISSEYIDGRLILYRNGAKIDEK